MSETVAERLLMQATVQVNGCLTLPHRWRCNQKMQRGVSQQAEIWVRGRKELARKKLAHRAAYEVFVEPIPPGMLVLHTCDNGCCINPRHLFLGTHRDNMIDMADKQRGTKSKRGLPRGVRVNKAGRFAGEVQLLGKREWIGSFDTVAECSAAVEAHREHMRVAALADGEKEGTK